MESSFLTLKALHIIFVLTWFAGLFYLVRLFVYHTEAQSRPKLEKEILSAQFLIMEKRLWYGITWPSCVLTMILGPILAGQFSPITDHPWLMIKILFVLVLFGYHLWCGKKIKQLERGLFLLSSNRLRLMNEVPTVILVAVVFLVVLKSSLSFVYGLFGLGLFSAILMAAIKIYKNKRKKRAHSGPL